MNEYLKKLAEAKLLKIVERKLKNSSKEENIPLPNNWVSMINMAKSMDVPSPEFNSNSKLGNKLLDHALEKSARAISEETDVPVREVTAKVWSELQNSKVAKKNAISTIRFLRDIGSEIFLECPECGFVNSPNWEICENCGNKND